MFMLWTTELSFRVSEICGHIKINRRIELLELERLIVEPD